MLAYFNEIIMKNKVAGRRLCPLFFVILLSVSGCGSVGMMASKTKSYSVYDTLTFEQENANYLDEAAKIGTSLGYDVSSLNRAEHTISFSQDAGLFIGVMIGKIERSDVKLNFRNNGMIVDIEVWVLGNFDRGGQEAGTEILNVFKSHLARM